MFLCLLSSLSAKQLEGRFQVILRFPDGVWGLFFFCFKEFFVTNFPCLLQERSSRDFALLDCEVTQLLLSGIPVLPVSLRSSGRPILQRLLPVPGPGGAAFWTQETQRFKEVGLFPKGPFGDPMSNLDGSSSPQRRPTCPILALSHQERCLGCPTWT